MQQFRLAAAAPCLHACLCERVPRGASSTASAPWVVGSQEHRGPLRCGGGTADVVTFDPDAHVAAAAQGGLWACGLQRGLPRVGLVPVATIGTTCGHMKVPSLDGCSASADRTRTWPCS